MSATSGEDVEGVCHICKKRGLVKYCSLCGHFFCRDCRDDWFPRGLAAIKERFIKGEHSYKRGCCGPEAADGERA